MELLRMFPDDAAAERRFEQQRWPDGIRCPDCDSERYGCVNHKTMPYRCKSCRSCFSVRKGGVMQSGKLGSRKWAVAIYMATTGIKGVSSEKLHRELGITQKAAWHMIQRVREIFSRDAVKLDGTVEIDKTWMGGKRKNMHDAKRKLRKGGGQVGESADTGSTVHTDGASAFESAQEFDHDSVNPSAKEHVRGDVHTNGIESF